MTNHSQNLALLAGGDQGWDLLGRGVSTPLALARRCAGREGGYFYDNVYKILEINEI